MKMKPEEITAIIKQQIENYNVEMNVDDIGTVLEVGDGIAHVYGLDKAMSGELLELPRGVYGMALNLEEDNVGAVLLGDDSLIKEGDTVRRTGRVMRVPVGEAMIGRVVNPLGAPIDGKGEIKTTESRLVEVQASGIADRQPVKVPLQTGLKSIDSMVPIGRGQRELIIGDRGTGKTAIAIRKTAALFAFTSLLDKKPRRLPASSVLWKKTARWRILSSLLLRHLTARRSSTWLRIRAYLSANTSCIRARTSSAYMTTCPNTPRHTVP